MGLAIFSGCKKTNSTSSLPVISQIPEFVLTNQSGAAVSLADLRGKVWIADIIFTRCGGPCPEMTRKISELQSSLPKDCKLVTLTTDPEFDTSDVIKKYAERFGADFSRWMFLTGDKKEIYKLGVEGLKLSTVEIDPKDRNAINDLFIHATYFVLVDKQSRLRAVFETVGEDVDWNKVKIQILSAAKTLANEGTQ
jgi:protein SCO1